MILRTRIYASNFFASYSMGDINTRHISIDPGEHAIGEAHPKRLRQEKQIWYFWPAVGIDLWCEAFGDIAWSEF